MPRGNTRDPNLLALLDKRAKLQAAWKRSYARMRCNFKCMEKTRRQLARLNKRVEEIIRLDERISALDQFTGQTCNVTVELKYCSRASGDEVSPDESAQLSDGFARWGRNQSSPLSNSPSSQARA
jgi:hypothetical protein